MRSTWYSLVLAAAIGWSVSTSPSAAAAPSKNDATPAAVKPQPPETRPSTPEDEALKSLIGKRKSSKGITLSSGPPTRPHKVLGTITVEAPAGKTEAGAKPGPNLLLNELLRARAVEQYGEKDVDGIMSITYTPAANGKLKASGTVVHFTETADKKK